MKTKILVKKYEIDLNLSWEERYKQLEKHHEEESQFLIRRIEVLEEEVENLQTEISDMIDVSVA